jgi:hypothetical protein
MRLTTRRTTQAAATVCLSGVLAGGCSMRSPGEMQTVTRTIELDKADSVDVELKMSAGELRVGSGTPKLAEATFRFNVPEWEPVVDYKAGARGALRVQQGEHGPSFGRTENQWDVKLSDAVPVDLVTHLGAGQATLSLGAINLRSVEVHMGAGELQLDLTGTPKHSYDVRINGGVGSARVRVPRSVGIRATAKGGIGSIDMRGLEKRDNEWVNAGHEQDAVTIRLDIKGGGHRYGAVTRRVAFCRLRHAFCCRRK